ncbi:type III-B CRISPR-associated protein Cas10/Cmr2 [Myxococcota bacterium]|nr:type III-B CRISPR-associated protein Cas10/Cmr2 [Myxococcota bacterium]
MSGTLDRAYALRAWALLLPWDREPGDEGAFAAVPREVVKRLGLPEELDPSERALVCACAIDAYAAQIGAAAGPAAEPGGGSRSLPALRHPLSATSLRGGTRSGPADGAAAYMDFMGSLGVAARGDGQADSEWYRDLWFQLAEAMSSGPAAMVPGSRRIPDFPVWAHRTLTAALVGARYSGAVRADGGGGGAALLYLHLGPVQDFIAAARRTHDLWVGSFTVSYLAFRMVREIVERAGPDAVVYPDPTVFPLARLEHRGPEDVEPQDRIRPCIPNKLLAVVPAGRAPELAQGAAARALETWMGMAEACRAGVYEALARGNGARDLAGADDWRGFAEQVDAHLEIDAVVQPWPDRREDVAALLAGLGVEGREGLEGLPSGVTGDAYGALFDTTHRLLVAHRRAAPRVQPPGDDRPKCDLCGERERMGPARKSREFWRELGAALQRAESGNQGGGPLPDRLSLQVADGEGLCAVCFTKRHAPRYWYGSRKGGLGLEWERRDRDRPWLRFPSTASIASAPLRWRLAEVRDTVPFRKWCSALDRLHARDLLSFDPPGNLVPGVGEVGPGAVFPFDGTWCYESAYDPATAWRDHREASPSEADAKKLGPPLLAADRLRRQVLADLGPGTGASPYYAVLAMDVDRLGEWLTGRHRRTPTCAEAATDLTGPPWDSTPRPLFPALHREISRRIARLATRAIPEAIEGIGLGRVVYCGGDDVLALLPLRSALPVAQEVRDRVRAEEGLGDRVGISAGIAVAHFTRPLSRAIQEARDALHEAKETRRRIGEKGERDRWRVRAAVRSGAPLVVDAPFEIPRPRGGELRVIDGLLDLQRDIAGVADAAGDAESIGNVAAAYALEREVGVLDAPGLEDALIHRLRVLLGTDRTTASRDDPSVLLEILLARFRAELPPPPGPGRRLVDLLLLLRFLERERHGLPPWGSDGMPEGRR